MWQICKLELERLKYRYGLGHRQKRVCMHAGAGNDLDKTTVTIISTYVNKQHAVTGIKKNNQK